MIQDLRWYKSSYSSGQGGACVEVADLPGGSAIRDSKNVTGPALVFATAAWSAFITRVRAGDFG